MELGKYQIFEELGRGAFATVYRALDTTLEREVALKILHPQLLTDPTFVERFKREARAMANLDHQHIATVYEIGEAEERVYIAMQLARGSNLGEAIAERGRFSWKQALALLRPLCEALDYAHSRGTVHRDLKPSNVLLDSDEDRGPMLTDFGFARLMGDSSVSLSLSGGILGTTAYIAPEVWELDKAEPPADVYALGCILYEVLIGEVLFAGKTPMQVMRAHDRGPQFPQEWPEDVPEGIEAVLEKALARDPQERYASGMALWHALNDLEAKAQAAEEAAQQAAVAAQWREEAEAAMAVEEWSVAKMAVARWLAITPNDPDAQKAQAEINRQLEGPPVEEEEEKEEKKEGEENEPDQDGEPTDSKSVPSAPVLRPDQEPDTTRPRQPGRTSVTSSPKVPAWAWALGGVALLALVTYLAGALGVSGEPTPEIVERIVTVERERLVTATPEIVEKVMTATPTSTPRPSATATSIPAPTSERLPLYEFFNDNDNDWQTGTEDNIWWRGTRIITEREYVWQVKEAYKDFVSKDTPINAPDDFYVSVDAQRVTGPLDTACYNLVYRENKHGYYIFQVCDDQRYRIRLRYGGKWETLIDWARNDAIRPGEVNKLAVSAVEEHFAFFINDQFAGSIDDDTLSNGNVGMAISLGKGDIATFEFDDFALRKPYNLCDYFNNNDNDWSTGTLDNEWWRGTRRIEEGKYVWNVKEAYRYFIWWNTALEIDTPDEFYVSVDAQRVTGPVYTAYYGLVYRRNGGYYTFEIRDDQSYRVRLNYEDEWGTLINWTRSNAIRPGEVNKLAVNAVGDHFEFFINDQFVDFIDDDTLSGGDVGVAILAHEGDVAVFEFDNFVLREP